MKDWLSLFLSLLLLPALASPSFCEHQTARAEHFHHEMSYHDNIDDEPVAEHTHTHRHSPDEPEHSHEHSHQIPSTPGFDFHSIVYAQGVMLLPPPVVKVEFESEISVLSKTALTAIFRPPIS